MDNSAAARQAVRESHTAVLYDYYVAEKPHGAA